MSACAAGPDFRPPAPPQVSAYTAAPLPARTPAAAAPGGAAQRFIGGLDVSGRWWTLYRSPALDALVERALTANSDLQAAQAALKAAREAYYAQRGSLLPTLAANYSPSRQKVAAELASPLASNDDLFTLHTAQLSIAYVPDLFGGVRRQVESTQAQAEAQRFQTEATYLTLISNLVAAVIQEAMLRDQIQATREAIRDETAGLRVMRDQFAHGEIARGDVAAQQTALAQLEQTLPPLEKQRAQQADLIAVFTGQFPAQAADDGVPLSSLRLPIDLPVSLPSALVRQRPDVRAAEASLHAASAQIGVAAANRLPTIALSATSGGAATTFAHIFDDTNRAWTLTGSLTQPVFEGGALRHRQRAAEAAYDQAEAQYRSTVKTAFQNVADVLEALQSDARTLAAAANAEASAQDSLAIARRTFEQGQVSSLTVINAEQAYQQARISRIQAQAVRYADTAALFQAVGGGWWNRADVAPTSR